MGRGRLTEGMPAAWFAERIAANTDQHPANAN
jgi:hypothetical protein